MELPHSTHLAAGQLAGGGRYELRRLLGQGGMGTVWLAFDSRLKEEVALKFLPVHIIGDAVALDDLRNEALKSRRLSHPNIVRIHDLSEALDEIPFISMEYVNGSNLNELRLVQPAKVFTWDYLQPLVLQLCEALQYAHDEGVVHRDLKPGNLMLDARSRLKLADFGIASIIHDSTRRSAAGVAVSGTPGYMSPQQMLGKVPSVADDIYSLGATLYELLTGRPPFYSGDVAYQILNVPAVPIEQRLWELSVENHIPPNVSALILSCLAKEPVQRPPSAKTLVAWLKADLPFPTESPATPEPIDAGVPTKKPRLQGPVIAGAVSIVLVSFGVLWLKNFKPGAAVPSVPTESRQSAEPVETSAEPSSADGWQTILGGKTLLGWDGDRQFWSVRDGSITCQAPPGWKGKYIRFLVWREGTVKNFELKFQFRVQNGANSGILYRGDADGVGGVAGYQFEMWKEKVGNLLDVGGGKPRRDVATRGQKVRLYLDQGSERTEVIGQLADANKLASVIRENDWNDVIIRAEGTRLTHVINGHPMIEANDENTVRQRLSGLLAVEFYGENDQQLVQYRDMQLRQLP